MRRSRDFSSARSAAAARWLRSTGLVRKFSAPLCSASTAMGTSPYAVIMMTTGIVLADLREHVEAGHVGQADVEEHEVGAQAPVGVHAVAAGVGLVHHVLAVVAEEHGERSGDRDFVVDDQDAGHRSGGVGLERQLHFESRALARFRPDSKHAAMFADDAVGDRQAEARARSARLGGEERIEDVRQRLGRRCPGRCR